MTYPDPHGWHLTSHSGQHAAPYKIASPRRGRARRALRLFVTAGTWAAGLCLVLGSIVLVVKAAGPGRPAGAADSSDHRSISAGDTVSSVGYGARAEWSAWRAGFQQVAEFAGRGDEITGPFPVRADAIWQLRWSYRCPAGVSGQLTVEDAGTYAKGTTVLGASINEAGAVGHGAANFDTNGRTHHLIVISSCHWTLKVVQSR